MRRVIQSVLMFVMVVALVAPTHAAEEDRPVQLSLFNPVQLFPEQTPITGFRFNLIYGKNASVTGVDWGLVNHTTSGETMAWQAGLVGLVDADFLGFQDNAVNMVKGQMKGVQWGLVNYAKSARGIQVGFVNVAERMYGIQIGLANVIQQGGFMPVFPIVNWSF